MEKRWKKHLSKRLIEEITKIQPDDIRFKVIDDAYTICLITKNNKYAFGVAICSTLDKFDLKVGKNKAAGRAVKAFKKQYVGDRIRLGWKQFLPSWTLRQAERVLHCPFQHKSYFFTQSSPTDFGKYFLEKIGL